MSVVIIGIKPQGLTFYSQMNKILMEKLSKKFDVSFIDPPMDARPTAYNWERMKLSGSIHLLNKRLKNFNGVLITEPVRAIPFMLCLKRVIVWHHYNYLQILRERLKPLMKTSLYQTFSSQVEMNMTSMTMFDLTYKLIGGRNVYVHAYNDEQIGFLSETYRNMIRVHGFCWFKPPSWKVKDIDSREFDILINTSEPKTPLKTLKTLCTKLSDFKILVKCYLPVSKRVFRNLPSNATLIHEVSRSEYYSLLNECKIGLLISIEDAYARRFYEMMYFMPCVKLTNEFWIRSVKLVNYENLTETIKSFMNKDLWFRTLMSCQNESSKQTIDKFEKDIERLMNLIEEMIETRVSLSRWL